MEKFYGKVIPWSEYAEKEASFSKDKKARKEVIDTIIKLNKEEHITIILITHYMNEV